MVIRKTDQGISKKTIINSSELVPGDLIEITNNLTVPADVVIIYGSCVVDDNFKSDQNSTTTKIAIEKKYNKTLGEIDNINVILSGNKVLYTMSHINEGCFGLVVATGFATQKG